MYVCTCKRFNMTSRHLINNATRHLLPLASTVAASFASSPQFPSQSSQKYSVVIIMSGDEISERFIVGIESFLSLGSAFLSKATGTQIPPLSTPAICHLYGSDTPTTEFFLETSITAEDDVCVASDWLGKCRIPFRVSCELRFFASLTTGLQYLFLPH